MERVVGIIVDVDERILNDLETYPLNDVVRCLRSWQDPNESDCLIDIVVTFELHLHT